MYSIYVSLNWLELFEETSTVPTVSIIQQHWNVTGCYYQGMQGHPNFTLVNFDVADIPVTPARRLDIISFTINSVIL